MPVAPSGLSYFSKNMKVRGTCGRAGWSWSGKSGGDWITLHHVESSQRINEKYYFRNRGGRRAQKRNPGYGQKLALDGGSAGIPRCQ